MPDRTAGYWALVVVLCVFGIVGIFSIGMPILLLGLTLAVVAPWRSQPAVLWPAVTAVVAFVAGFLLVTPLGCSTSASSASSDVPAQTITCTNVLGIDYSGQGQYNPSQWPALLAGLALSALAAATVRVLLRRGETDIDLSREQRRRGTGSGAGWMADEHPATGIGDHQITTRA